MKTKKVVFPDDDRFLEKCFTCGATYILHVKKAGPECSKLPVDTDDDVIFVSMEPPMKKTKSGSTGSGSIASGGTASGSTASGSTASGGSTEGKTCCIICHSPPIKPVLAMCCSQILGCSSCVRS